MAMNSSALKSKIKDVVFNSLKEKFGKVSGKDNSSSEEFLLKIAEAVAESADPIVETVKQATILPGIPVSGAAVGATTAPGKLM
jgi:hypothetical protein